LQASGQLERPVRSGARFAAKAMVLSAAGDGKYFSMPCLDVVPKPLQKPRPPVWVARLNSMTIKRAARHRRFDFCIGRPSRG
jgi:alkanesulfonate monooxygenase SsuD/methylene tetrahydromethanopterin reductase-like flavin-dependent oxidoreductase (luciferase family)